FFADQPFWAQRVEQLGVGPEPVPLKQLTADRLAAAIRTAVTDEGIARRAADLGQRLRAEDGVGNAVGIIDRVLRGGNMPAPDRVRADAGQSSALENGP
ncbi:MAG: hypothetical protein IH616_04680, partial [Gemmatimonadales bacterium]|nr:hypothetical protein [Gemmatimonadales bacterium]